MSAPFRKVMVSEKINPAGTRDWITQQRGVAKFHQWGCAYEEFETGPGNYTAAVVEFEDGTVDTILPHHIQFVDGGGAFDPVDRKDTHDEVVAALKAEHRAVDWLMARLIALDPEFMPTKSPVWPSLENTAQVLVKVGAL